MWTLVVLAVMAAQVTTVAIVARYLRQRKIKHNLGTLVASAKSIDQEELREILEGLLEEFERRSDWYVPDRKKYNRS